MWRRTRSAGALICGTSLAALLATPTVLGSDHGDSPFLIDAGRRDALLTDLFAFTRDEQLVLIVCLDPSIPVSVTDYQFASDLRVEICIDNDPLVTFDDPDDLAEFGGTIVKSKKINKDVKLRIEFNDEGEPALSTQGLPGAVTDDLLFYTGLRDDRFIRGPRIGRNVAAIFIQLPLAWVLDDQSTLLLWATSSVSGMPGPFQELAGRSLRSMFPENDQMNFMEPHKHFQVMGVQPDVMIFDTSLPAVFPNGRELTDDVVDLVGHQGTIMSDAPFPSENDLRFLDTFPYLAAPHPPP